MAAANAEDDIASQHTCETVGCEKEAKLQCPTCIKLQISGSFFCSQECFKGSWGEHKQVHKKAKESLAKKETKPYIPWPGFYFTGKLRPAPRGPLRDLPVHIDRPDYADHPDGYPASEMAVRGNSYIKQLKKDEIEGLRAACKLGREVLDVAAEMIRPGITTDDIDAAVHQACIDRDCYPSPLNYRGFPKSCCTSVNEVICHGIPDQRPLEDGDIVNVDITVYYKGFHGDLNETFFVGKVNDRMKELVRVTYESMMQAIDIVKPGVKYREVGAVIQKHCQAHGFSVVRTYCGHGIHRLFHTAPNVPFYAKNKAVGVMKPGHAFTIEPMVNEGVWKDALWPDDWTAVTTDGKWSAQFEHTMIVTETGVEVLTARGPGHGRPHFLDQVDP